MINRFFLNSAIERLYANIAQTKNPVVQKCHARKPRYLHFVISNGCSCSLSDTLAEMNVICLKALVTRAAARVRPVLTNTPLHPPNLVCTTIHYSPWPFFYLHWPRAHSSLSPSEFQQRRPLLVLQRLPLQHRSFQNLPSLFHQHSRRWPCRPSGFSRFRHHG